MNYLLLAYRDEQQWNALSPSERADLEDACLVHRELLRQNGYLLVVAGLQSSAITVRVQDDHLAFVDDAVGQQGQLTGLFFIQARDLNEAIRLAAQMPQAQTGPIVVQPTQELDLSLVATKEN
jgi:hypothetical protein